MLVNGRSQNGNQLVSQVFNKKKSVLHKVLKSTNQFSKEDMWKLFLHTFHKKYGYHFIRNEETIENIKILFFYFLQDKEFFKCENLRLDITQPSFKKGLLIVGGYGLGKTDYFSVFEEIFKYNSDFRFKCYPAKSLVLKYEHCTSAIEKDYFFRDVSSSKIFIDDIGSERLASNYGKVDVVKDIIK